MAHGPAQQAPQARAYPSAPVCVCAGGVLVLTMGVGLQEMSWTLMDTAASLAARDERELGAGTVKAFAAVKQQFLGDGQARTSLRTVAWAGVAAHNRCARYQTLWLRCRPMLS